MKRDLIYPDTVIVPQTLKQNARRYFSHNSKVFFPVQNNFQVKNGKN